MPTHFALLIHRYIKLSSRDHPACESNTLFASPTDLSLYNDHRKIMAEPDNALFAIEVDTEDYAGAAAADTEPVSRTHQSQAQFAAVKASYQAKQDNGNHYAEMLRTVPLLGSQVASNSSHSDCSSDLDQKSKLGKREQLLLGYTVGELYYDGEYATIVELCERVKQRFETDKKLAVNLEKWSRRAGEKMVVKGSEI